MKLKMLGMLVAFVFLATSHSVFSESSPSSSPSTQYSPTPASSPSPSSSPTSSVTTIKTIDIVVMQSGEGLSTDYLAAGIALIEGAAMVCQDLKTAARKEAKKAAYFKTTENNYQKVREAWDQFYHLGTITSITPEIVSLGDYGYLQGTTMSETCTPSEANYFSWVWHGYSHVNTEIRYKITYIQE